MHMPHPFHPPSPIPLYLLVAAVIFPSLAFAQPTYNVEPLGLTGPQYSPGPGKAPQIIAGWNSNNNAAGSIARYASNGTSVGYDAWYFNGYTNTQIGLTGPDYSFVDPSLTATYENSRAGRINPLSQVIGNSQRYNSASTVAQPISLGQDAWLYNGTTNLLPGLTAGPYSYQHFGPGGGTYRSTTARYLNDVGQVAGTTFRYASDGTSLGEDSWLYSASQTRQIGLIGGPYSYAIATGTYQSSRPLALNNTGDVLGESERFDSSGNRLGSDMWLFDGASAHQIGLTGAPYSYTTSTGGTYQSSLAFALTSADQTSGTSSRYDSSGNSLGQDSWAYSAGTTTPIGLTGGNYSYITSTGGTFEENVAARMNLLSGQVIGHSLRYDSSGNSLGDDTWIYDGTSTKQIGLTDTQHSYTTTAGVTRNSSVEVNNSMGQAAGESNRYGSALQSLGSDAWLYDGTTTRQIGLTGGQYSSTTSSGNVQNSSVNNINDAGQVIGVSTEYYTGGYALAKGKAGWFYDPATNVTTPLIFSTQSGGDEISNTDPEILTSTGNVLGSYELYNDSTDEGPRAFFWNLSKGFYDLGSLTNGQLTAGGYNYLSYVLDVAGTNPDGFPQYILADAVPSNQSPVPIILAIPEPPAAMLLACLPLLFAYSRPRHRRRRS
jgi:hypothetical protein